MNPDSSLSSRPLASASGSSSDSDEEPPSREPSRAGGDAAEGSLTWIDRRVPGSAAAAIRVDLSWLISRGRELATHLPEPVTEVAIALLDDAEMDRLHREHCGVAGTTDVLSYLDPDGHPEGGLAGDLAIGVEVAEREAAVRGRRIEEEIMLYVAHGLLHLAGERDDTLSAATRMREAQDRIMRAIGLPTTEEEPSP
jgi:probable rRNA maturation factor